MGPHILLMVFYWVHKDSELGLGPILGDHRIYFAPKVFNQHDWEAYHPMLP